MFTKLRRGVFGVDERSFVTDDGNTRPEVPPTGGRSGPIDVTSDERPRRRTTLPKKDIACDA
jgi:hypothetical protein